MSHPPPLPPLPRWLRAATTAGLSRVHSCPAHPPHTHTHTHHTLKYIAPLVIYSPSPGGCVLRRPGPGARLQRGMPPPRLHHARGCWPWGALRGRGGRFSGYGCPPLVMGPRARCRGALPAPLPRPAPLRGSAAAPLNPSCADKPASRAPPCLASLVALRALPRACGLQWNSLGAPARGQEDRGVPLNPPPPPPPQPNSTQRCHLPACLPACPQPLSPTLLSRPSCLPACPPRLCPAALQRRPLTVPATAPTLTAKGGASTVSHSALRCAALCRVAPTLRRLCPLPSAVPRSHLVAAPRPSPPLRPVCPSADMILFASPSPRPLSPAGPAKGDLQPIPDW